ncbi:MAG: malonyl-ACP O-methyltransferase BioC [Rhodocyclaceae bacterium]|nr:malonyl-ACP O-methyltransferase BioC [Rhodocyclaceae bacterium]
MNKVRIAFDRAAPRYDEAAALQREVGTLLLQSIPTCPADTILDTGCGTGHGTQLLRTRWPQARLIASDFAFSMLRTAGGGVCADLERLPFAARTFDLYWSNLAFQWCDGERAVSEAARVLIPGGRLAVSSLAPGTLAELDSVFSGLDSHRHVLDFAPAQTLTHACHAAGFQEVTLNTVTLRCYHPDLKSLLHSLKSLGANQVGSHRRLGLLGRRGWQTLEGRYEALRSAEGLPVTYEVVVCTAKHDPSGKLA